MVVILFDIDGTLLSTRGAGQQAMNAAIAPDVSRDATWPDVRFAGRTDRSIIHDHLRAYDLPTTHEHYVAYRDRFLSRLPDHLSSNQGCVLPGVVEALDRLTAMPAIHLGLLTGNMKQAARMKLDHYELSGYFYDGDEVTGGFGDDHFERSDVAREALQNVVERLGGAPWEVWVVGDTPHDVSCARAISANVLAVATGGFTRDQLDDADLVVEDLTVADAWWAAITRGLPA